MHHPAIVEHFPVKHRPMTEFAIYMVPIYTQDGCFGYGLRDTPWKEVIMYHRKEVLGNYIRLW